MKSTRVVLTAVCAAVLSVQSSPAQDVEARVSALETKVDRVLAILEKQSSGNPVPTESVPGQNRPSPPATTSAGSDEVVKPTGKEKRQLRPGAMLSAYLVPPTSYATPQLGDPLERFVDTGSSFVISNYLATPSSKTFETHQVGVKWSGQLYFDSPGSYMFTGVAVSNGLLGTAAASNLSVSGQSVVECYSGQPAPTLATLKVETVGFYLIEVWLAPSKAVVSHHNDTAAQFEYRKQGATKFEKITPGVLFSEKEE